jgi:uncharacterized sulfatase
VRAWLSIALALATGCGADLEPARELPPNLVLIVSDDQGHEDFGFMGSEIALTPRLDALAASGTVFTGGYATASVCQPSLQTLLTGLQPAQFEARTEALRLEHGEAAGPTVRHVATLPRLLAERGYQSFQSGKYFEGTYSDGGFTEGMNVEAGKRAGDRIVRDGLAPVLDFIDRHREEPFFLWFAPKLPHVPHDPPVAQMRRYAKTDLPFDMRTYYASLSWLDTGVGTLLDHLEATGLQGRTVVVFLVDNGWVEVADTPLGGGGDRNVGWLGGPRGKLSLYDPGLRTPIIFSWPGQIEAGRRLAALVSIADVFPTLLHFAGSGPPADRTGVDLVPVLTEGAELAPQTLIGHMTMIRTDLPSGERLRAGRLAPGGWFLRSERWHYLGYALREAELYDLAADPHERHNVAAEHPDRVRAIRAEIQRWFQTTGAVPELPAG